jgi:hypothetical protein
LGAAARGAPPRKSMRRALAYAAGAAALDLTGRLGLTDHPRHQRRRHPIRREVGELHEVGHTSGLTAREKRALVDTLAPYETHERGLGEPSRWNNELTSSR